MADLAAMPAAMRRERTSRIAALRPVILIWLALAAFLSACRMLGISPNNDVDDILKLLKLRAYLVSRAWFDPFVPGILQPEPFASHWPRILDLPYTVPASALAPLLGGDAALAAACFAVPILLLLPAMVLFRRIIAAYGFSRPDAATALAAIPAMRALFEFEPGRIDYHNIQIALLLASVALLLSRRPAAAAANGALVALALAAGLEFAPFHALVLAVVAVEFIADREGGGPRLASFGGGLAVAALAAFPVVVAPGSYGAAECDAYALPHLAALLMAGAVFIGAALARRRAERPLARAMLIALPAGVALALVAYWFPSCGEGPYGALSPYLRDNWLLALPQERSLFTRTDFVLSPSMASAAILFVGALAPVAALVRIRDRKLVIVALFGLVSLALSIAYFRYIRYLPLFAGPGLVLMLSGVAPGLRAPGALLAGRFGGRLPSVAAMVAPGAALAVALVAFHLARPAETRPTPAAELAGSCAIDHIGPLRWPAGARVMAPPILAIRLLPAAGGAAFVAAPFHTAASGLERAYRFFDPATATPRATLDESRATHVAVCALREGAPPDLRANDPLAAALMEGRPPGWLEECPTPATSPIRIYRVLAAGGAAPGCP